MRVEQQQQWRRISRDGSKSCCGQSPLAPPSPYFSLLYIYLYCSNTITSSSSSFSFSFCRRRRAVAAIIIFRGNLGRLIDRPARKPAVVRFSHGRLYIKMAGSLSYCCASPLFQPPLIMNRTVTKYEKKIVFFSSRKKEEEKGKKRERVGQEQLLPQ